MLLLTYQCYFMSIHESLAEVESRRIEIKRTKKGKNRKEVKEIEKRMRRKKNNWWKRGGKGDEERPESESKSRTKVEMNRKSKGVQKGDKGRIRRSLSGGKSELRLEGRMNERGFTQNDCWMTHITLRKHYNRWEGGKYFGSRKYPGKRLSIGWWKQTWFMKLVIRQEIIPEENVCSARARFLEVGSLF